MPGANRKDDPDGEMFLWDLWEEGDAEMVLDVVQSGCEVRAGRPEDHPTA